MDNITSSAAPCKWESVYVPPNICPKSPVPTKLVTLICRAHSHPRMSKRINTEYNSNTSHCFTCGISSRIQNQWYFMLIKCHLTISRIKSLVQKHKSISSSSTNIMPVKTIHFLRFKHKMYVHNLFAFIYIIVLHRWWRHIPHQNGI